MATVTPNQLLQTILSKANVVSDQLTAAVKTFNDNDNKTQESFRETANLQKSNATAAELVTRTQGLGQLEVENAIRKTAVQLGTDLADSTGLQAELSRRYLEGKAEQRAALDVINQKKAVSFFDDPLGYIMAQFTIDDDIQRHNAANAKAQQAAVQIEESNKLLDARAIAAARQKATVSAASVEAAAVAAGNVARVAEQEAIRAGLVANSTSIQNIINLRVTDMQMAATGYDAAVKQANLGIAQAQLKLSQEAAVRDAERLQLSREEASRAAERAKREGIIFDQTQAAGNYVRDMVVLGYQKLYPNQPDKWEVPNSPKMIGLMTGKIPLDGELKAAFELGILNSKVDPSGRTRILAATPVDALKILQYRPELSPDAKSTVQLMTDALESAKKTPAYKTAEAAKNLPGMEAAVNAEIQRVFQEKSALVSGPDNPYYLPSIDAIVKMSPNLKTAVEKGQFPAYSKVVAPLAAAGVDVSDPSKVFSAFVNLIQKGEVSLNQGAIELATIYKQGQRVNIESKQMLNLGLTPLESYKVKINTGGMFNDTVDMANPNEIIRAALRLQANIIRVAPIPGINTSAPAPAPGNRSVTGKVSPPAGE